MGNLAVAGQKVPASFPNQYYGVASTSPITVTAATQQPLTQSQNIPANEPILNSTYEVIFGGTGVWGATQQLIALTLVVAGTVVVNTVNGITATVFAANAGFRFNGRAQIIFSAIGVSGSVFGELAYVFAETANAVGAIPVAAASNSVAVSDGNSVAVTVDTTSSMSVVVKCGWAGTTGAPTITNRRTVWRKIA